MLRAAALAAAGLLSLPGYAQSQVQPAPDLANIVSRMSVVQREVMESYREYELMRRYELFGSGDQQPRTEVLAKINYTPPGQKSYHIEQSTGGMGERAIRHALDREVDLTKDPERVEMTQRNYTFTFDGTEDLRGVRCYVLETHPKHGDRDLLKAKVWVDASSFHILKIQGHPQKSPSFWVKDVDLTLEYGELGGMWMHITTKADADVRFSGPFKLLARNVSIHSAATMARVQPARHKRGPVAAIAGAAIH